MNLLAKSIQFGTETTVQGRPTYRRYKIEARHAPPRRKQPHPFNPKVSRTGLARMLLREALGYGFKLRRGEYRSALLSRPCIYGVFSGRFGGFNPIREKCTGCMRCVQEFPGVCTVDRNPEFYTFADSYWVPDDPATASGSPMATVSYEAETGKIPIKGMGYKGAFAGEGWDSMWTDMSEIVRPTRDGVYGREYISTSIDFGRKQGFLQFAYKPPSPGSSPRNIEISLPIIFDYLPPKLSSQCIVESIASSANQTGTMFIASPDQAQQLPETLLERLIPLISSANVEASSDLIRRARAVELNEYGSALMNTVREVNPKVPISVRLPLSSDTGSGASDLVRAGVDVLHLVADYHGREVDRESSLFVKDLVRSVHGRLVQESIRDEVTLIVSGGIILGTRPEGNPLRRRPSGPRYYGPRRLTSAILGRMPLC